VFLCWKHAVVKVGRNAIPEPPTAFLGPQNVRIAPEWSFQATKTKFQLLASWTEQFELSVPVSIK